MNLVYEKENRKIINLLAELGTIGGEASVEMPDIDKWGRHGLFPPMIYGEELTEEVKRNRDKHLILKDFLLAKKLEGCSNQTIKGYYDCLFAFTKTLKKPICDVTTADIRGYLSHYGETRRISNGTLDNMRRIFSSYFEWLQMEDYCLKNPVKKIKHIKSDKIVKKPFRDEEVEALRDAARTVRELAIIDLLNSSGMRVGELCGLNISDIDFQNREGIVFGKGAKERPIYFDAKTKLHLMKYLESRIDDNPALFVSVNYPYRRLQKTGVELMLKEVACIAGIDGVYPHRFRRTLASNLIDKGVPIEQVQQILGHTKIDTTLIYAMVNQHTVKLNHGRFT